MEDTTGRGYFTQPTQTYHRRYEALRAVIVEGRSQKEVADTFGFRYRSVRQLVYEFRQLRDSGRESTESPFFETSM
jgi:transposase